MRKIIFVIAAALTLLVYTAITADQSRATQSKQDSADAACKSCGDEAIVCRLDSMTPAERNHYEVLKKQLKASVKEVKELPNGYAFRYGPDPKLVLSATEFITLERKCCSFYSFSLEMGANEGPTWMRVTGPKGAKRFIKEALAHDFAGHSKSN